MIYTAGTVLPVSSLVLSASGQGVVPPSSARRMLSMGILRCVRWRAQGRRLVARQSRVPSHAERARAPVREPSFEALAMPRVPASEHTQGLALLVLVQADDARGLAEAQVTLRPQLSPRGSGLRVGMGRSTSR